MPITSDDRYLIEGIRIPMTEDELIDFKQRVKSRYDRDFLNHLEHIDNILLTLSVDLGHAQSRLLYSETLQARQNIQSIMAGMKLL